MLRTPVLTLIALLIIFFGGISSAIFALNKTVGFGKIHVGSWSARPIVHTQNADPYSKAHRARRGDLLLGSAEGLLFTATTDDTGSQLSGKCRYLISGTTPSARFWSLRIQELKNHVRVPTFGKTSALNSTLVLKDKENNITIQADRLPQPGNWLFINSTSNIELILTLYDTPAASRESIIDVPLPTITKVSCYDL